MQEAVEHSVALYWDKHADWHHPLLSVAVVEADFVGRSWEMPHHLPEDECFNSFTEDVAAKIAHPEW